MSKLRFGLLIVVACWLTGCTQPSSSESITSSAPGWSVQDEITTSPSPREEANGSLDREHAIQIIRKEGYDTDGLEIPSTGPVRAIVAMCSGYPSGKCMGALFFNGSQFIETLGGTLVVIDSQDGTTVILSFPQYQRGDAWCCPSGGDSKHSVQVANGKLIVTPPIPDDANNVRNMI